MMSFDLLQFVDGAGGPLAVVPIVVNAGAAILPGDLAAITTFMALLFKPRELLRVCREKPSVPITMLCLAGTRRRARSPSGRFGGGPRRTRPVGAKRNCGKHGGWSQRAAASSAVYVDWTRVALARIEAKQRRCSDVRDSAGQPSSAEMPILQYR